VSPTSLTVYLVSLVSCRQLGLLLPKISIRVLSDETLQPAKVVADDPVMPGASSGAFCVGLFEVVPETIEADKHFSRLTLDASEQRRLAGDVYSNLKFVPGCVIDEAQKACGSCSDLK
jgi:hypothetical protein